MSFETHNRSNPVDSPQLHLVQAHSADATTAPPSHTVPTLSAAPPIDPSAAPTDDVLPIPAGHRRNAVRRIFRDMIKGELESGPLSKGKRRELVDFAVTAGLTSHEARLTVRAVEFEMGMAGDLAFDPLEDEMEFAWLTPKVWFLVRLLSAGVLGWVIAQFIHRMRGG